MLEKLKRYKRCLKHRQYLETRVTTLRSEICSDAIRRGVLNTTKRDLMLKYNERLKRC